MNFVEVTFKDMNGSFRTWIVPEWIAEVFERIIEQSGVAILDEVKK